MVAAVELTGRLCRPDFRQLDTAPPWTASRRILRRRTLASPPPGAANGSCRCRGSSRLPLPCSSRRRAWVRRGSVNRRPVVALGQSRQCDAGTGGPRNHFGLPGKVQTSRSVIALLVVGAGVIRPSSTTRCGPSCGGSSRQAWDPGWLGRRGGPWGVRRRSRPWSEALRFSPAAAHLRNFR